MDSPPDSAGRLNVFFFSIVLLLLWRFFFLIKSSKPWGWRHKVLGVCVACVIAWLNCLETTAGHFTLFGVSAGRAELSIMGSGWGLIGIHWRKCMSATCFWVKHLCGIDLKPMTCLEGIQGHCGLQEMIFLTFCIPRVHWKSGI